MVLANNETIVKEYEYAKWSNASEKLIITNKRIALKKQGAGLISNQEISLNNVVGVNASMEKVAATQTIQRSKVLPIILLIIGVILLALGATEAEPLLIPGVILGIIAVALFFRKPEIHESETTRFNLTIYVASAEVGMSISRTQAEGSMDLSGKKVVFSLVTDMKIAQQIVEEIGSVIEQAKEM